MWSWNYLLSLNIQSNFSGLWKLKIRLFDLITQGISLSLHIKTYDANLDRNGSFRNNIYSVATENPTGTFAGLWTVMVNWIILSQCITCSWKVSFLLQWACILYTLYPMYAYRYFAKPTCTCKFICRLYRYWSSNHNQTTNHCTRNIILYLFVQT